MSELEHHQPSHAEVALRRRNRFLQWNIATLLLLMAVVGTWTSYFRTKSETVRIDAELDSLRQLARELVVNDPSQYAVVERHEEWHDDHVWDVHLPEGSRYVLKLATREVGMKLIVQGIPRDDFPDTDHVVELAGGKHVISLEKVLSGENASARAIVDESLVIEVSESSDWCPSSGSSWDGGYKRSTQAPTESPLELIRIRFFKKRANGTSGPSDEPFNGIVLWIERKQ